MTSIRDRWPFQSFAHGKPSSSDVVVAGSRVAPEGRGPFVKHQQQPKLKTHTQVAFEPSRFFFVYFQPKGQQFFWLFCCQREWPWPRNNGVENTKNSKGLMPSTVVLATANTSMSCAAWASRTPGRKAKEEKEARRKSWSQLLGICENESIHYALLKSHFGQVKAKIFSKC